MVRYQFGSTFKAPSATGSALLYCCCRNMRFAYCKGARCGGGGLCSVWGTCKTIINAALLLAIFHLKRVKEAANYDPNDPKIRPRDTTKSLPRSARPPLYTPTLNRPGLFDFRRVHFAPLGIWDLRFVWVCRLNL